MPNLAAEPQQQHFAGGVGADAAASALPKRYAAQSVASAVAELRDLTADLVLGGLDALSPQDRQAYERLRKLLPGEAAALRAEWPVYAACFWA